MMTSTATTPTPIVKHSKGKHSKRQLRQLKKGRGKLVDLTDRQVLELKETAGSDNIIEVPIVVYYELEHEGLSLFK